MYSLKKKLRYSGFILLIFFLFIFVLNLISQEDHSVKSTSGPVSTELNIIIDPGHGGEDGGAVSPTGTRESEVNLDISLKTRDILGLFGIIPTLTRDSENIDYPDSADTIHERKVADQKARLELINSTDNAVLISIHQNKFSGTQPFGAETLYAPTNGSMEFAESLQSSLLEHLNPDNYRTAGKISDSIYLMNNINCPGILVECGFLSNPQEDALLKTAEYRLKIAAVITSGYFTNENDLKEIYFGGTNESKNNILLH